MLLHRYANSSVQPIPTDHPTEGTLKAPLSLLAMPLTSLLLVTSLSSYDAFSPPSHGLSPGQLLMQLWGGGGLVLPVLALQAALNKVFTRPRGAQL